MSQQAGFSPDALDQPGLESGVSAASRSFKTPGAVKWFDAAKGYGFIVADDGLGDVMVHISVVRRDGFECLYEGDGVEIEVQRRPRGLQVIKILSVNPSNTTRAPMRGSTARRVPNSVGALELVVLKWFNHSRGFGFLTRGEGTEDIFVHIETLRRYGFADAADGDCLLARYGRGDSGLVAAELRPFTARVAPPNGSGGA